MTVREFYNDPSKWVQGTYQDDCHKCLIWALATFVPQEDYYSALNRVSAAILKFFPNAPTWDGDPRVCIPRWNDDPFRKFEDIIKVIEEAKV